MPAVSRKTDIGAPFGLALGRVMISSCWIVLVSSGDDLPDRNLRRDARLGDVTPLGSPPHSHQRSEILETQSVLSSPDPLQGS